MKTLFKSNMILVAVIAAMVSLTSCAKDELTPTNTGGESGDTNSGVGSSTLYQPGWGTIIPQRQAAPTPAKNSHKKHRRGEVSVEPQLSSN